MLAKKQQPAVAPSEGELISCGQTAAMAVINKFVDAEKGHNPSLPREMLLQMAMHISGMCVQSGSFHFGQGTEMNVLAR